MAAGIHWREPSSFGLRDFWTQGRMWTALIVVENPLPQNPAQVPFSRGDHKVQALAPYRSNESLTVGIGLG